MDRDSQEDRAVRSRERPCRRLGCERRVGLNRRGRPNKFCSPACAGAAYLSSRTHDERVQHGREGGRTHAIVYRADILARYDGLSREDAIVAAWKDAKEIQTKRRYQVAARAREARP